MLGGQDFAHYYEYKDGIISELSEIKLSKHTLVVFDIENIEKTIFLIENYVKFFIA